MKSTTIIAMLCGMIITACISKKENIDTKTIKTDGTKTIEFSMEQYDVAGIILDNIERKNLRHVIKASGYLKVPPQYQASVSSFLGGVVKSINIMEGDIVRQGQLLATLDNPEFIKLQQQYLESKSSYTYLEKEYQRQKELYAQNAGTGKIFQKTESDYITEKGKLASLGKQLALLNVSPDEISSGNFAGAMPIIAPIRGNVGRIEINIGKNVQQNEKLFEITDNTKIHCDLVIYEKDLFKVKIGQKISFVLTNLPEHQEEHHSEAIEGQIFSINKSFQSDTKSLTVHATIKNEKHELIPGMYVNALIDIGGQTSLTIPEEAVVKSGGKEYIFILAEKYENKEQSLSGTKDKDLNEQGVVFKFKMMEVISGISDLGFIEIKPLERLTEDAKVAVKGSYFILSKAMKGESEE